MHVHVYVRCMCIGNTVMSMCIGNTVCMNMSMLDVCA